MTRREVLMEPGIPGWFSWLLHWQSWLLRCRRRGHDGEYICRHCGTVSKWVDNVPKPRTVWVGRDD